MSHSLTVHQGMTSSTKLWKNPNLYPEDQNGKAVETVKVGHTYCLCVTVENNGTETEYNVTAAFYIFTPGAQFTWPASAHGTNVIPSLAPGESQLIMCTNTWVISAKDGTHECLVAAVSSDACTSPVVVGSQVKASDQQVAQHNVTVSATAANAMVASRVFHIQQAANPGKIVVSRQPLADNKALLACRGIDPDLPEAPQEDSINLMNPSRGSSMGPSMNFNAGESHDLNLVVTFKEYQPGTAAIYDAEHYENGVLIGGVSLIVLS